MARSSTGRGRVVPSLDSDDITARLARRVRELRERAGTTQRDLARASGISGVFLGTVERGEKSASVETIGKIARGLGVPPHELLRFDERAGEVDPAERLARRIAGLARGEDDPELRKFEHLARVFFAPDEPAPTSPSGKRTRRPRRAR